jgi:threonine/homoserine/homoserine lactone efflux protein
MPDLSSLAMPFFASLALVIVPGPTVLYIITRSVDHGRTAGFASAAPRSLSFSWPSCRSSSTLLAAVC